MNIDSLANETVLQTLITSPKAHLPPGLKFSVKTPRFPGVTILVIHGAGLNWNASLYRRIAEALAPLAAVVLLPTRSSSFISFDGGFRRPSGWGFHRSADAVEDLQLWLSSLEFANQAIVPFAHSWGALLLGQSGAMETLNCSVLLSPLPQPRDLLEANFGPKEACAAFLTGPDLNSAPDAALIRTSEGAPYPFLSAGTVRDLRDADWLLSTQLNSDTARTLVILGSMEHPALKEGVMRACSGIRSTDVVVLDGQGHFYTGDLGALRLAVSVWLQSSFKKRD